MFIKKYNLITDIEKKFLLTCLLLLIQFIYLYGQYELNKIYFILIFINSFICIWNMIPLWNKPYSLRMFINIFIYVFFILANAIQLANKNNVLTFTLNLELNDYIYFQFILFFILIFYNYFYCFFNFKVSITNENFIIRTKILLCISIISTFITIFNYRNSLILLFARGIVSEFSENIEYSEGSIMTTLLFKYLIRPIPWASLILCLITKRPLKITLFLFLLTLVTMFPTGLARNSIVIYWFPIFILSIKKYIKGYSILFLIFFGLFIIFPFLDNFRHFNGTISYRFSMDYLDTMNFDASQIFMAVIKTETVTFGHQLLGSLLFFFPRSLWLSKPLGSGAFMVESMNGWFTNVSMPFFAEGFINFGIIGIFIYTFILAFLTKSFDYKYWINNKKIDFFQGYYLVILGAIIYIMRGDFMSSFAYTSGTCLCYYLVKKISIVKL